MTNDTNTLMLIVIVAILAVWTVYRQIKQGAVVTPTLLSETIHAVQPVAQDLLAVGTIAAQAAEQMARDPNTPLSTNDQKLHYAIDYVRSYLRRVYPDIDTITDEDVINAINSGVLVASALSHQIQATAKKSDVTVVPLTHLNQD